MTHLRDECDWPLDSVASWAAARLLADLTVDALETRSAARIPWLYDSRKRQNHNEIQCLKMKPKKLPPWVDFESFPLDF